MSSPSGLADCVDDDLWFAGCTGGCHGLDGGEQHCVVSRTAGVWGNETGVGPTDTLGVIRLPSVRAAGAGRGHCGSWDRLDLQNMLGHHL